MTTHSFAFYLDAWKFCVMRRLEFSKIKRKDWKTWVVETE